MVSSGRLSRNTHYPPVDDAHLPSPLADLVVADAVDGLVGPLGGVAGWEAVSS